jgi:VIT1/CCC1 family predicted Fe2+/Mn2+ transporter
VLLNTALLRKIAKTSDQEARDDLVQNAVVEAAEDLERQLGEAEARASEEQTAREAAESTNAELATRHEAERQRVEELEARLSDERRTRVEVDAKSEANATEERLRARRQIAHLERDVAIQEQALVRLRGQIIGTLKIDACVIFYGAAIATVALLIVFQVVDGVFSITALLFVLAVLLSAGVAVIAGRKRGWQTLVGLGVVLGVFVAIYEVVDGLKEMDRGPPAPTVPKK